MQDIWPTLPGCIYRPLRLLPCAGVAVGGARFSVVLGGMVTSGSDVLLMVSSWGDTLDVAVIVLMF